MFSAARELLKKLHVFCAEKLHVFSRAWTAQKVACFSREKVEGFRPRVSDFPAATAAPPAADPDTASDPDDDPTAHRQDRENQVQDMIRPWPLGENILAAILTELA